MEASNNETQVLYRTFGRQRVTWGPSVNFAMGVGFVVVGALAATLQYWLWRFPMAPDPTGRDPNGVTTAPKFWRYAHRALGYLFVALYLLLALQMVPRIWRFDEAAWTPSAIAHAVLGLSILPVLLVKVGILRFWQRHGKKLPLLGTLLALSAIATVALVTMPYLKVASGQEPGRSLVAERCYSCHASSRILSEDGDFREWLKTLEDMSENAEDMRRPDPVQGDARTLAEYLSRIRPDD